MHRLPRCRVARGMISAPYVPGAGHTSGRDAEGQAHVRGAGDRRVGQGSGREGHAGDGRATGQRRHNHTLGVLQPCRITDVLGGLEACATSVPHATADCVLSTLRG
eukprot:5957065-Prymnesium_polylepis.1